MKQQVAPGRAAWFDTDMIYRYSLSIELEETLHPRTCVFIMLNPSTADAFQNDPTVTRCIRYAREWGFEELAVLNLFAYRSTDPRKLNQAPDPVGPLNDMHFRSILRGNSTGAPFVVCAWGTLGGIKNRDVEVMKLLEDESITPHALRVTKSGYPSHPLYLPADLRPMLYSGVFGAN